MNRHCKGLFRGLELAFLDTPRIYADGVHDDAEGLVAAIENRRVIYDGHVYKPDESLVMNRELTIVKGVCVVPEGKEVPGSMEEGWIIARLPADTGREISYVECDFSDCLCFGNPA